MCSSVSPAYLTCWQGKTEDGGEVPMNVGVFADKTNLADSPVRVCGKYVERRWEVYRRRLVGGSMFGRWVAVSPPHVHAHAHALSTPDGHKHNHSATPSRMWPELP